MAQVAAKEAKVAAQVLNDPEKVAALKGRMEEWQKTLASNCHDALSYNTVVLSKIIKHWSEVYEVPVSSLLSLVNGGTRDLCLGELRERLAKGIWDK